MSKEKIDRAVMIALIEELNEATEDYESGNPVMSDEEWDGRYFELIEMERQLGYVLPNSPTQKIHFVEKVSELTKIKHNHEMLSLAKSKEITEIQSFLNGHEHLAMLKLDGLTCSLRYQNGQLISAETRGDGIIGEDILHNAMRIKTIPKHIDYKEDLIIDGEIICMYDDFEEFKEQYKNPRNFAAGSIRLLDATECEKRKLTFVAWDIINGFEEEYRLSTKLIKAKENGFVVVPFWDSVVFDEILVKKIKNYAEENYYPIDGVVVKFNDIDYGKSLGKTAHHFNNAIAYKFYDETHTTSVKYIEWTMGRTGVLTPVAVLEPIDIDGSTVERASCHNLSIFKEMKLRYQGQEVDVFKANQISPQIAKVHEYNAESASVKGMEIPETCPICGGDTETRLSDGGIEMLYCANPQCEGKLINKLDHFCGKKGLDIKGLSKATLEKLIDWGWVNSISDLFTLKLHELEWKEKPGFGEKSVNNILMAIDIAAVGSTLDQIISAIGIPLIGKTIGKDLGFRFQTYEEFRKYINKGFDFSQIDGYGPEMTKAILTFDYSEIDNLILNQIIKIVPYKEEKKENNLEGLVFVITGKLHIYKNRNAIKEEIEARGGKVSGSISRKTNYLINNDINSTSSKNKFAQEHDIPIISEENFIDIFDI